MTATNYQEKAAHNHRPTGQDFETLIGHFLRQKYPDLQKQFPIELGIADRKRTHKFDFGCQNRHILVECKAHRWTKSYSVPNAKMSVWNETMYYFNLCPPTYTKMFFCLRDFHPKKEHTLAKYYIDTYAHLIPGNVIIWEYDSEKETAEQVWPHGYCDQGLA